MIENGPKVVWRSFQGRYSLSRWAYDRISGVVGRFHSMDQYSANTQFHSYMEGGKLSTTQPELLSSLF